MPAAVMTYDTLIAQMTFDLEKHDVDYTVEQFPYWIMLAEKEITSEMKPMGFEQFIVSNPAEVAGTFVIQKPVRWRSDISMAHLTGATYTQRTTLKKRNREYIQTIYPSVAVADRGTPRFYADYGPDHWMILPVSVAAFKVAVAYYEELEPLSDVVQTNWLTRFAPQVLLKNALKQAALALQNDERVQVWQGEYQAAKAAIMGEDFGKAMDQSYSTEAR